MWDPWGGVALIIVAVTFMRYVKARTQQRQSGDSGRVRELETRLSEVERRLSDVQDIVLAIDDRLERRERLGTGGS
ncbi:MAG: hypothetical protein AB1505_06350 [Candidatus Latescibacterota bacterium]